MSIVRKLPFLLFLSFISIQAVAENAITHAVIKLPFEVQANDTWSRVKSEQEALSIVDTLLSSDF